jgi:hypothetical protein
VRSRQGQQRLPGRRLSFEHGGRLVGLFTTLGFALALGISSLE